MHFREFPLLKSDGIDERPEAWQGALDREGAPEASDAPENARKAFPVDLWLDFICPTYNQAGPSCCGHSWANWIEAMVRRWVPGGVIPAGCQIDGEAIWTEGRRLFWGGDMNGGLYLDQGFKAAQSLGWIPPTARAFRVPKTWPGICAQLAKTPLVQGHKINRGWFRANRENGCIDHEAPPDGTGYHATLLCATLEQPDLADVLTRWTVTLNSWGQNRGRFGLFTMTFEEWLEGAMDDMPWTAEIPDVKKWSGWIQGVKRKG